METNNKKFVQGSMFHELVPECILTIEGTEKSLDAFSIKLLDSLGELNITQYDNYFVHYGIITADPNGILLQTSDTESNDLILKGSKEFLEICYVDYQRWNFKSKSSYTRLEEVKGYIESLMIADINGKLEPCLRVVNDITDIGYDDTLILIKDIANIKALPPNVSEALVILDNNLQQDGISLSVNEAVYLNGVLSDENFRTVWTPAEGYKDPWNN